MSYQRSTHSSAWRQKGGDVHFEIESYRCIVSREWIKDNYLPEGGKDATNEECLQAAVKNDETILTLMTQKIQAGEIGPDGTVVLRSGKY
jgi:hypothetical protein